MNQTTDHVYTKEELLRQLAALHLPQDRMVLMHSSLRSIGKIEGGAEALLDTMIEYCTRDGGLFCVPTHTWNRLGQEITLDLNDSHTCLGAFSDLAARDPRGIRSLNPTHSMAVFGDPRRAEKFVRGESEVCSGTAAESCYGKLFHEGGTVLLVGVAHNRNTYLHAVDEMLGIPNRITAERNRVGIRLTSGEVLPRQIHFHHTDYTNDVSLRFPLFETPFRYHGAITDGRIGNAPTQACDARLMKEVMERIFSRCGAVDPLADERPIPPAWYC